MSAGFDFVPLMVALPWTGGTNQNVEEDPSYCTALEVRYSCFAEGKQTKIDLR